MANDDMTNNEDLLSAHFYLRSITEFWEPLCRRLEKENRQLKEQAQREGDVPAQVEDLRLRLRNFQAETERVLQDKDKLIADLEQKLKDKGPDF